MSRDNPLRPLAPLPDLPRIIGVQLPPDARVTSAPEHILVTVDVSFSDGHRETCNATARAWTADAVCVFVQARDGQYVTWLAASQVRRRSAQGAPAGDGE